MGINKEIYDKLSELNLLNFSIKKNAIIIGEQQFYGCNVSEDYSLFKHFLIKNGWSAESIDLGSHPVYKTALKHDLACDLPESLLGKFDILFDFGTGEHVRNQLTYWKNCEKLLTPGGERIHVLPLPNTWQNHCKYRYPSTFFDALCEHFKYENKVIEILEKNKNSKNDQSLIFVYFLNSLDFNDHIFDTEVAKKIDVLENFIDKESL